MASGTDCTVSRHTHGPSTAGGWLISTYFQHYRLLSWAGKSIEPYGIDYILNKLGFSHARTTIPKWLQRGFMDPLDKVEALLMLQLLLMVKDNGTSDDKDSSRDK